MSKSEKEGVFLTPGKTRKRHASVTEPDEAAKNQIVEVIYDPLQNEKSADRLPTD